MGSAPRVAFLTGTRADWGKLRPLASESIRRGWRVDVIATGQHLVDAYGYTVLELERYAEENAIHAGLWRVPNGVESGDLAAVLSDTAGLLARLLRVIEPTALVVHGDRTEALAGAFAGMAHGCTVVHVEGGEQSGSIDHHIRRMVTSASSVHLVSHEEAARRVRLLGARADDVYVIGSPEIDTLTADLPPWSEASTRYDLPWDPGSFGICVYHPVVADDEPPEMLPALRMAILATDAPWLVLTPNADPGSARIVDAWRMMPPRFRVVPSMRFELYATALKHAAIIVGNSSSGVREAPVLGTPSINVGVRQRGRADHIGSIRSVTSADPALIEATIRDLWGQRFCRDTSFGDGRAAARFGDIMEAM